MSKFRHWLMMPYWLMASSFTLAVPLSPQNALLLKPPANHSLIWSAAGSLLMAILLVGIAYVMLLWWRGKTSRRFSISGKHVPALQATRRITRNTTLMVVTWQDKMYLLAENHGALAVLDSTPIEAVKS